VERAAVIACIGLGANLGDRAATIKSALRAIDKSPGVSVVRASPLIETAPVLPPGGATQPAYLNAAAVLCTSLTARALLNTLLDVERRHGRERASGERWAPRTLDLDLLLYGDDVVDEPGLTVPHPELAGRRFVLEPLAMVAPDSRHPLLGVSVAALLESLVRTA